MPSEVGGFPRILGLLAGAVLLAGSASALAQVEDDSGPVSGSQLLVEDPEGPLVLIGGNVLDIRADGLEPVNILDAVVVIEGDSIVAIGSADSLRVPGQALVVDVEGRWILPGLIDSFAALNNQAYADAFLRLGVTSIVGVADAHRGDLFLEAEPGPRLFLSAPVGEEMVRSVAEVEAQIDRMARDGVEVARLMVRLDAQQVEAAVARARMHGMATVGELGFSSYAHAVQVGVDAFVHTARYSLDPAPHVLAVAVANDPYGEDLAGPKWSYYNWLSRVDLDDPFVAGHIRRIGGGHTALIPAMSFFYLDLEGSENPWFWPGTAGINPVDVDRPADRETGEPAHGAGFREGYRLLSDRVMALERRYREAGASYLAGSGSDVGGTLPGVSLHTELELLTRIGLSPREAIEAATVNPARVLRLGSVGRIEPGYRADILVVEEDPTEDIRRLRDVSLVVAAGRVVRVEAEGEEEEEE